MWLEFVLAVAITANPQAASPSSAAALPEPITTRQAAFSIPFRVDGAQQPAQQPAEIHLYVSADRGANWRLYDRVDPKQERFLFRAGGDGEYWFSIRTLDRAGQLRPGSDPRPGLRVVVDTIPPRLQLDARAEERGRIATRWRVEDAHLDSASFKLQYRTAPTQPWQPVAIDRQLPVGPGLTGEASWLAQADAGRAEIRAEVLDKAGNPAVSHAQVEWRADRTSGAGRDVPPDARPRMVNARVFELDYGVASVGPSGIAKVEIWGTRDKGQTWTSFGQDTDKQSPALVTVNEDGVYGFCIFVQNGVGLGAGPPRAGQAPDVWIGVDRVKPDVRLISAEQGTGEQSGRLLLRWEAHDWVLAPRPISLYFGETMGGPWTPILREAENTGQYNWLADVRVPPRVYLRVEARDEAGNVGVFETPRPIVLDRLRPTVQIRDVHPIGSRQQAAGSRQ